MSVQSMRRVFVGLFILAASGAALTQLGACETVKGAGKDATNVGEAGERAINGK